MKKIRQIKMKKHYLLAIVCVGMLLLSGCGEIYTEEEATKLKADAKAAGVADGRAQIDITVNDAEVVAAATPEQLAIIATLEADKIALNGLIANQSSEISDLKQGIVTYTDSDTVVSITGGYNIDNRNLDQGLSIDITDSKLSKLIDSEVSYDGEDYDVSEVLKLTDARVIGSETEPDFGDKPYLILPKYSVVYEYRIEDAITGIDNDKPLTIKFLGKDVQITKLEDGDMTIRTANDYFMNQGQSVTVSEKVITLLAVGSASAIVVDVDGVMETIPAGDTETVNGIEITNDEVFYDANDVSARSATLYIGDNVKVDVDDGDFYDDDELWKYEITKDSEGAVISLTLNEKHIDLDHEFDALALGDSIELPEGYLKITFAKVDADYTTYELEDESENCYRLSTSDEDINDLYDEVFIVNNTGIYTSDECTGDDIGTVTLGDSGITMNNLLVLSEGTNLNEMLDRDEDFLDNYGIVWRSPENWKQDKEIEFDVPEEQLEIVVNVK